MSVSKGGSIDIRRTDNGQIAGPFLVLGQVSQGIYRLGSNNDSTGVYNVTFKDQTRRPGRFTLAVGGSMLDIMPARIGFNKAEHQWGQQPQQSAPNPHSPSVHRSHAVPRTTTPCTQTDAINTSLKMIANLWPSLPSPPPQSITSDAETWAITYVLPWNDTEKGVPSQNPTNGLCKTIITVRKYEASVQIQPKPE